MTQPKPDDLRRELRGGSWDFDDDASEVFRSAARSSVAPTARIIYVGFRTTLAGRTPR
jgi:formylglycine-generating enzyme required for sulfatase activity